MPDCINDCRSLYSVSRNKCGSGASKTQRCNNPCRCAPSRATLLTGRFPLRHGLLQNPAPDAGINDPGLSPSEVTMAEILRANGYHTKCIGKWHLGHGEILGDRLIALEHPSNLNRLRESDLVL